MLFTQVSPVIRDFLYEKSKNKIIVLPEGDDQRVIEASKILKQEYNIECLLGNTIESENQKQKTLQVMENLAKNKGKELNPKIAALASDTTFHAGALLALGEVHAVVSGCNMTTAHVIRAALNTVGLKKETKIITSAFLLAFAKCTPGGECLVIYSDCAVMPKPTSEELVSIAYLSAHAFSTWTNQTPRISFLSFSTAGSAEHPEIDKVRHAVQIFTQTYPEISTDGEIQFDAACVPEIAKRKNPNSQNLGKTNVFIFPDLNAGNIGYKISQYIGGAKAWGPILLGSAKPFSDLSRGATSEDIAHSAVLTLALN